MRHPLPVRATLHSYASIEAMLTRLPHDDRDERESGDTATILQRVVEVSGASTVTVLRIRMPGLAFDKKPNTQLYAVAIAAPVGEVVKQLNNAGAIFDPLRPSQNGFMKATRYNYDVA